jgi:hypothetical protein
LISIGSAAMPIGRLRSFSELALATPVRPLVAALAGAGNSCACCAAAVAPVAPAVLLEPGGTGMPESMGATPEVIIGIEERSRLLSSGLRSMP